MPIIQGAQGADVAAYLLQVDPVVSGHPAPVGAFAYSFNTGKLYLKIGGDPTEWTQVALGSGGGGGGASDGVSISGNGSVGSPFSVVPPYITNLVGGIYVPGPDLVDGDQTIIPGATFGQFTMPAGTVTHDITITVSATGCKSGLACWITILPQAYDVSIYNDNPTPVLLYTVPAGLSISVNAYFNGSHHILNFAVPSEARPPVATSPASVVNGTKILFVGDSITAGSWFDDGPGTLVPDLNAQLAPGSVVTIISGVAGNKVADVATDVAARITDHNPDIIVIELGVNDVGAPSYQGEYYRSWLSLLNQIRAWRADVPIIVLSVFLIGEQWHLVGTAPALNNGQDPIAIPAYNALAQSACNAISPPAIYVDLRGPATTAESVQNAPAPGAISGVLTVDQIHPSVPGKVVMSGAAAAAFSTA